MNNPAIVILDGLSTVGMHWRLGGGIFLLLVASLLLLLVPLRKIFGATLAAEEHGSLSLAGWLLPASLISLLWYAGARMISPGIGMLLAGLLLVTGLVLVLRTPRTMNGRPGMAASLLPVLAVLSILLRLAYVSKAIVPLYFDSAQHYHFIDQLLSQLKGAGPIPGSPTGYYHLGFHFLAAFVTSLSNAEITDGMLVLGQVILALIPFSAFFMVRHGTGSSLAGFFALALAAFGWYMPAHAVDWGKYPALASLALIPFVLILAHLFLVEKIALPGNRSRLGLLVLMLAAAAVSTLLHSRSLVVFALAGVAWLVTLAWYRMSRKLQILFFLVFVLILVGEVFHIRSQGILGPLFDAYGPKTIWIAVSVLVLAVFAWRSYPGLVFFCVVSIALLLVSLFIPLGDLVPGYANTTLLDRPYVQMILYLPLTLLAGFGLAGLEQLLAGKKWSRGKTEIAWGGLIGALFILLVVVNAWRHYELYPSDCCDILSRDDLAAIHWVEENLPADARILTSSTDLNVLPTDQYQGSAGGDAGTWITPITGRLTVLMPYNTDFSRQETLDVLCSKNVSFVYVGKTGWYFDEAGMSTRPENYQLLLNLPLARVYAVSGCG